MLHIVSGESGHGANAKQQFTSAQLALLHTHGLSGVGGGGAGARRTGVLVVVVDKGLQ